MPLTAISERASSKVSVGLRKMSSVAGVITLLTGTFQPSGSVPYSLSLPGEG